jgi:hypothetical protein
MDGFDMALIAGKGYDFVHLNLVAQPKAPRFPNWLQSRRRRRDRGRTTTCA